MSTKASQGAGCENGSVLQADGLVFHRSPPADFVPLHHFSGSSEGDAVVITFHAPGLPSGNLRSNLVEEQDGAVLLLKEHWIPHGSASHVRRLSGRLPDSVHSPGEPYGRVGGRLPAAAEPGRDDGSVRRLNQRGGMGAVKGTVFFRDKFPNKILNLHRFLRSACIISL